jgi:hypothetical protein
MIKLARINGAGYLDRAFPVIVDRGLLSFLYVFNHKIARSTSFKTYEKFMPKLYEKPL